MAGSAALWFVIDVLTDFRYYFIFFLAPVYLLYAPLVVAHIRP